MLDPANFTGMMLIGTMSAVSMIIGVGYFAEIAYIKYRIKKLRAEYIKERAKPRDAFGLRIGSDRRDYRILDEIYRLEDKLNSL